MIFSKIRIFPFQDAEKTILFPPKKDGLPVKPPAEWHGFDSGIDGQETPLVPHGMRELPWGKLTEMWKSHGKAMVSVGNDLHMMGKLHISVRLEG